jgi:hypothetical protein
VRLQLPALTVLVVVVIMCPVQSLIRLMSPLDQAPEVMEKLRAATFCMMNK